MSETRLKHAIRILYMEDDPGLARLFQKKLRRAGYSVDIARDGEEGLAMYNAGSYDVVATDQTMPVYNGLEVIRLLASQGPLPPTIMVTGTGNEQTAVEAIKLGANDYIVKDVDGGYLDLLPTVIERVLQQQRLLADKQRAEEALRHRASELELWRRSRRLQNRAQASGLTLVAMPVPPNLPVVQGDQARLIQALGELVANGITFTLTGGQVTIQVETAEKAGQQWVTISVRDTGPGISPEEQEQVFDRFFRGSLSNWETPPARAWV